jgi:hypothetical protein
VAALGREVPGGSDGLPELRNSAVAWKVNGADNRQ